MNLTNVNKWKVIVKCYRIIIIIIIICVIVGKDVQIVLVLVWAWDWLGTEFTKLTGSNAY